MVEPIQDRILKSIQAVEGSYYRLILLVGKTGSGKTKGLRNLAEILGTHPINISLKLSAELLEVSPKKRALSIPKMLSLILDETQTTIVLDNLEVLFDKDLMLSPLQLLQLLSRNRTIIAAWNGAISRNKLTYAKVGHPEYRSYDTRGTLIVCMDEVQKLV